MSLLVDFLVLAAAGERLISVKPESSIAIPDGTSLVLELAVLALAGSPSCMDSFFSSAPGAFKASPIAAG